MQTPNFFPDASGYLIHDLQLQQHGGLSGVRDPGLLTSAMHRPQNVWHYNSKTPDIADCAAAYAVGIARNHPFADGNKRTAAVLCETFLRDNGYTLKASDEEWFESMIRVATGEWDIEELANWLRLYLMRN